MTQGLTFDDLIGTRFRWPKPGNNPFETGVEEVEEAALAANDLSRFELMLKGYRRSADALVDMALADSNERDLLIYPILFLYRHALELNLKYIINHYGRHVGVYPVWKSHEFQVLWPRFRAVLDAFPTHDLDSADEFVGGVIAQFGNVEMSSNSHRYPYDVHGNPIPLVCDQLNLQTLKDVMTCVFRYFDETDDDLGDLISYLE
ncbi:MAG: hypothetical protein ACK5JT_08220 [Hyphomicrobiaceae bacterium]